MGWRHLGGNGVVSDSEPPSKDGEKNLKLRTGAEEARAQGANVVALLTQRQEREMAMAEETRRLNLEGRSKEIRRRAALVLARDGSEAAMAVLRESLAEGTVEVQALIADALGQCTNVASGLMLQNLLTNASEAVVLSAIRGLGQQASPLAVSNLNQLLFDGTRSADVRAEAALALGTIARPEALAALASAAVEIKDEAVASQVMRGIAGRSLEETRLFLQTILESPHVSADLKAEALEGLGQAQGDPTSLLLQYAKSDDPELRAAAARALSAPRENAVDAGSDILALLGRETDPLVRKRLYQALGQQENFDLEAAWTQAWNERDPAARIAGLGLMASAVKQNPTPEMVAFFDANALPELKGAALGGATRDERMASVVMLRRAQTANALAALRDIAAQASDPGIAAMAGTVSRRKVAP